MGDESEDEIEVVSFTAPLLATSGATGIAATGAYFSEAEELIGTLSGEETGLILGIGAALCFTVAVFDVVLHR